MRRFNLPALAACILLFGLSAAPARAEFTAIAGWDKQLFPSYIIATASIRHGDAPVAKEHLGDPTGLLGVAVKSPAPNTPVRVSLECPEYFETSTFSGMLTNGESTYRIFPKIKFDYDRLARCTQAAPAVVTFRVQLGDQAEEEQTVTFTIRSVNDCPIEVSLGDEVIDTSFTFAAYVNEQHPFVDKLLREALDIGVVDRFTGYQSGDEKMVLLQAYALWDLLVARDMRYSDITTSAAESASVESQHVRLLEDSVNNSQANCVDGAVLWVSMMRKIGIDAFLVMEPNHCYAAFYADAEHEKRYAVETTLLGQEISSDDVKVPDIFGEAIEEDNRDEASFPSFVEAVQSASKKLTKNSAKYQSAETSDYRFIDVAAARKIGVLPIAFLGKEEFVYFDHSYDEEEEEDEEDCEDEECECECEDDCECEECDDDA